MAVEPSRDVRRIWPEELDVAAGTKGMLRRQAVASETLWSGLVETDPETMSAWHHHGNHETVAYVVSGTVRVEFGAGGSRVVEGRPGDFLYVPGGTVHREGNPTSEPGTLAVFRTGSGPPVTNVDGPDPQD